MEFEKESDYKEVWESLSEPEKMVCISMTHSSWEIGLSREFVDELDIDFGVVTGLIEKEIMEEKERWELAQRIVSGLKEKANELYSQENAATLSNEQRGVLQRYKGEEKIAESKNPHLRYRLSDEEFHNYIKDGFKRV